MTTSGVYKFECKAGTYDIMATIVKNGKWGK